MTQPAVPGSATRGAVDLTGLSASPGASAPASTGGDRDAVPIKATDATFPETVNRSARHPGLPTVVTNRLPQ